MLMKDILSKNKYHKLAASVKLAMAIFQLDEMSFVLNFITNLIIIKLVLIRKGLKFLDELYNVFFYKIPTIISNNCITN